MNLNELDKIELQFLAKSFDIPVSQNKDELINRLLEVDQKQLKKVHGNLKKVSNNEDPKLKDERTPSLKKMNYSFILKLIGTIGTLGILSFAALQFFGNKQKPECPLIEAKFFEDTTNFNIKIFDLVDYTTCNSYSECENELRKRLDKINQDSEFTIDVYIEKCKSHDYGIKDDNTAKKHCEQTNSDLIIYGAIESKGIDSLIVQLNYFSNWGKRILLKSKTSNELTFGIGSIFELAQTSKEIEEIENLIFWCLSDKSLQNGTSAGKTQSLKYLNMISSINKTDYSNAKVIEGLIQRLDSNQILAQKAFDESISRFPLNHIPYYERAAIKILGSNYKGAISDIQRHKLLKFHFEGYLDPMTLEKLDHYKNEQDYPENVLNQFEKDNKFGLGCSSIIELAAEYKETILHIPDLLKYCEDKGFGKYIEADYGLKIEELIEQANREIAAANNK